jgi:hypothetical protein
MDLLMGEAKNTDAGRVLLTIVVLSRQNTSYTFQRALNSLLGQSAAPCEILVIDRNNAGDEYSLSLQEDMAHYPDIRLLAAPDTGGAECRNAALKAARGEFISFTDGMDLWYPDKAERQIRKLRVNRELSAACCNGLYPGTSAQGMERRPIFTDLKAGPLEWILSDPVRLSGQCVYRRAALIGIGGFDTRLSAEYDADAMIRLSASSQVAILPEILFESEKTQSNHSLSNEYDAAKVLLYKNYDQYLRNRRLAHRYQMRLASKALAAHLWAQAGIHAAQAVAKAPLHSLSRLLGEAGALAVRRARFCLRSARLALLRRLILRQLLDLRGQKEASPQMDAQTADSAAEGPELRIGPVLQERPLQFAFDRKIVSVTVPAHVTRIPKGMFAGCTALRRVVLPASVMRIEDGAFLGCSHLQTVEFLHDSMLAYIGSFAFAGCSSLTSLTLSGAVSGIGDWAFGGCSRLASVDFVYHERGRSSVSGHFPALLQEIPRGMFAGCTRLKNVSFAEYSMVTRVADYAFMACRALTGVYLNGSITSVGKYAFACCENLETFVLPQIDGVAAIGPHAFQGCSSLSYFRFPHALTTVQSWSFFGCSALKYIKLPKNVMMIDNHAFERCSSLEYALLERPGVRIMKEAFDPNVPIHIRGADPAQAVG